MSDPWHLVIDRTVLLKVTGGDDRVNIPTDDILAAIGKMSANAEKPPAWHSEVWKTGYQAAISDLIASIWPNAKGGQRR